MNAKPPSKTTDQGNPNRLAQEVIDRLYEVAVDPARYEDLLDQWETLISPYRRTQGLDTPIALTAIDFESHFRRADQACRAHSRGEQPREWTPLGRLDG